MTQFSSCYFCGTALDATISDQPVVPDDLAPEGGRGRSVTLCPDCSRKLDAVMDEVRAALDAGAGPGAGSEAPAADAGESDPRGDAIDADVSIDASADEFFEEAAPPGTDDGDDTSDPGGSGGSDDTARPTPDAGTADAGGQGPGEDADEGQSARQTISALENSKVMRMLENREFPVERESFQVVAANAYGVTPSDVGKVIDMAIDRGLLAERNGDLVKPE